MRHLLRSGRGHDQSRHGGMNSLQAESTLEMDASVVLMAWLNCILVARILTLNVWVSVAIVWPELVRDHCAIGT